MLPEAAARLLLAGLRALDKPTESGSVALVVHVQQGRIMAADVRPARTLRALVVG